MPVCCPHTTTLFFVALAIAGSMSTPLRAQEETRGVQIAADAPEPEVLGYAKRHALVIGIDQYEDPAYPDLGYAVADARAVAKTLVDRFGFAAEDVRLILNQDATQDAIGLALEDWAADPERIAEDDFFVLFFAGHGITREVGGRGQSGYLVPVDGKQRRGKPSFGSLVGMADLEEISEYVPAKHALFILDCCFGGLAVKRAAPPIAAGLSSRARQVITAGSAEQPVLDAGGGGHSVFTAAVLDALEGAADLDNDQVITFGELFNHVGRTVEAKTVGRQTPLQATFPDHGGGNVALFSPDITPGKQTAGDRLEELRVGLDEAYELLGRFEDVMIAQGLLKNAEELWPQRPPLIPDYREWLAQAKDLLHRRPEHESWLQRTRQEAYLSQVVAGLIEEGEGTEPDWKQVEPALQFRFSVFTELLQDLQQVEERIPAIEARLQLASTIWQRSIGDHQDDWDDAAFFLSESVTYNHLDLEPQLGLVPLGPDPESGLWEFWHVESGTRPIRDEASGKLLMTGESGMVLVLLPGGTFPMGAQSEDPDGPNYDGDARSDEGPVHEVRLGPFFLSKFEMTQGQWLQIMGENPSYWKEDNSVAPALHPVEQVSWEDCRRTLLRVGLVLPTEAQWEYGARAGSRTPWWTGRERETLPEAANLADLSYERSFRGIRRWEDWDDGYDVHAPVGSLRANAFGLHDVAGNVWEWCQDWYGGYNLEVMNETGQRADEVQEGSRDRVFRGGSFDVTASYARSAYRVRSAPEFRINNLGVRPARVRD